MSEPKTQNETILAALEAGPLTQREATRLGVMRLASRVHELKNEGAAIVSKMIVVRTRSGTARVAQYTMEKGL